MPQPAEPEPVESVKDGYIETQPASADDVERAREQEEQLGSSAGNTKDRSLTGQTHPLDHDEVEGPTIADDDTRS